MKQVLMMIISSIQTTFDVFASSRILAQTVILTFFFNLSSPTGKRRKKRNIRFERIVKLREKQSGLLLLKYKFQTLNYLY